MSRFIHLFMAVCFALAAACTAVVANQHGGAVSLLLWLYNIPVILVAARAFRLAASSSHASEA